MLVRTDARHYEEIASLLREKTGLSDVYTPSQMKHALATLPNDGLNVADALAMGISGSAVGLSTFIRRYAFALTGVTAADFRLCSVVGMSAFYSCQSLSEAYLPACETVGNYAFYNCRSLASVSLPECVTVGHSAFYNCGLSTIDLPACATILTEAFRGCASLTSLSLPMCSSVDARAFSSCTSLQSLSLPMCMSIGSQAFCDCRNLMSLDLTGVSSVPYLSNSAFERTPIGGYSYYTGAYGSIYVPLSLEGDFRTAPRWSAFFDRIVGV